MPIAEQQIISFGGGVDAASPPHLISQEHVQTATNIDFSFEKGAARTRRGCTRSAVVSTLTTSNANINTLYRSYKNAIDTSPWYVSAGDFLYRGANLSTLTQLSSSSAGADSRVGITKYRGFTYLSRDVGTLAIKDNGTSATDWVKQAPATGPTITVSTLAALAVLSTGTWISPIAEGTMVTLSSSTITATTDPTTFRIRIQAPLDTTNLNTNGASTIGLYGFDSLKIASDKPSALIKVSRDYSIGDSDFTSYWHTEISSFDRLTASQDPQVLDRGGPPQPWMELPAFGIESVGGSVQVPISAADLTIFHEWVVPRTQFEFVGAGSIQPSGWAAVHAVRVIFEFSEAASIAAKDWKIYGAEDYPLTDIQIGYRFWETWGEVNAAGDVIGESAPSPESTPFFVQGARALLVSTASPTGSVHGITHRLFYEQGGLVIGDAYRIGSLTLTAGTQTFTHSRKDLDVLADNFILDRDVLGRSTFPNNVVTVSEPFQDRIFVGRINEILWSAPGRGDVFPDLSQAFVSHEGDEVQGLIVWPPGLVIVNRDSVYELYGNVFEGDTQDWVLQRSGSRHGSKAARTIVKTPFGIPLLDYDGLYLYTPGQGVDSPVPWVDQQLGDVWKGGAASDPATAKGSRVPYLNKSFINSSCATYAQSRLYLGLPTGTNTAPSTLFVIDPVAQATWWYTYPFNFYSLFWDMADDSLYAGTTDGKVMKLETGLVDQNTAGTNTGIPFSIKTREWTTSGDTVLENIALEHKGGTATLTGLYDGATSTLGTLTSSTKGYFRASQAAQIANNVSFTVSGTSSDTQVELYNISFDAIKEPPKIRHFKTEHTDNGYPGEKSWDVVYYDLAAVGTGTITAIEVIDNTNVMTNTITRTLPGDSGHDIYQFAFPVETFGDIAYTTFTAAPTGTNVAAEFKLWGVRYSARNEPPRITSYKTDVQSLEEQICDAIDMDINPLGTATAVVYVDNVVVTTATFTGTKQQSFTASIPVDTYGRTIYAIITGATFKHYKTWFHLRPEPDRWSEFETDIKSLPSNSVVKTWVAILNPLGTCTGTLFVNGTATATQTFTGTIRHTYETGLTNLTVGKTLKVRYTTASGQRFKHYETDYETQAEPFAKKTWVMVYNKVGGATRLDMARFYSLDIEAVGTATVTSTWKTDGRAITTQTHTFTNREYKDGLELPPDARGYIFQQELTSTQDFQVWRSNLDIHRIGIKGFSRVTFPGTPRDS